MTSCHMELKIISYTNSVFVSLIINTEFAAVVHSAKGLFLKDELDSWNSETDNVFGKLARFRTAQRINKRNIKLLSSVIQSP